MYKYIIKKQDEFIDDRNVFAYKPKTEYALVEQTYTEEDFLDKSRIVAVFGEEDKRIAILVKNLLNEKMGD